MRFPFRFRLPSLPDLSTERLSTIAMHWALINTLLYLAACAISGMKLPVTLAFIYVYGFCIPPAAWIAWKRRRKGQPIDW